MSAYYNEIDPYAAQWLRNLIAAGAIAPGEVDERSIVDVRADELRGFTQCHFFAGIGVWSHALRAAGWSDDRPVWTGSCPCQPFSGAGRGAGFEDPRHLWPAWGALIRERRPCVCFGEQVAGKDGEAWLDLVWPDLEDWGYAFAPVVLPAAGFGAPHGRHRIFFVADAGSERVRVQHGTDAGAPRGGEGEEDQRERFRADPRDGGWAGKLADAPGARLPGSEIGGGPGEDAGEGPRSLEPQREGAPGGMGDSERGGREELWRDGLERAQDAVRGCTNGFWSGAEWVYCRDPDGPRWRPVEPGAFPLAARAPGRVGQVRAYGNSIVGPVAEEFVRAYLEVNA